MLKRALATAAAAAVLGVLVAHLAPPSDAWLCVWAGIALACLPFGFGLARGRLDIFEPVYLFAVCYLLLFVLRPIADLNAPGGIPFLDFGRKKIDIVPNYAYALELGLVGAVSFYLGYYLPIAKGVAAKLPQPSGHWDSAALSIYLNVGLFITGTLFFLYVFTTGLPTSDVGALISAILLTSRDPRTTEAGIRASGYFYQAPLLLLPMGMLLVAKSGRIGSPGGIAGLILVMLSEISSTGSRAFQVPAVLSLIVLGYLLRGARPSLRGLAIGALVLFLVGIELPRIYRDSGDFGASVSAISGTATSSPLSLAKDFLGGADTAMIDDLSAALNVVPSGLPWQWGTGYVNAALQWIPRQVWPGKPHVADVALVHAIDPVDYPVNTSGGFAFSVLGEPYLNFGMAGIVGEMIVLGVFWRGLYEWFFRDPLNRAVAVLYALSWPFLLVYMRGSVGADYYRQLFAAVPAIVIILLVDRRRSVTASEHRVTRLESSHDGAKLATGMTPSGS